MAREYAIAAVPLLALAITLGTHVVVRRCGSACSLGQSLVAACGIGLLAVLLADGVWMLGGADDLPSGLGRLVCDTIGYGALSVSYFHFINMGETARRIRLLHELDESPAGLTRVELLNRYDGATVVEVRLARLVAARQLEERNGAYLLCSRTLYRVARVIGVLRRLLMGSTP